MTAFNYKSCSSHEDSVRDVGTFDVLYDIAGASELRLGFLLGGLNLHARVLLCGEWYKS